MGLLSILGGSKMDTGYAMSQADEAARQQKAGLAAVNRMNAPYSNAGRGSIDLLAEYLGINNGGLPSNATPYSPKKKTDPMRGQQLYLTSDYVYKYGDDGKLYRSVRGPDDYAKHFQPVPEPEKSANYGSLLQPFGMDDYQESPNYQFNLDQGQKTIDRAAAARGEYLSPAAVKELAGYSQNLASNEFLNSYNMYNQNQDNVYNRLMGVVGVGQQAVGQQGAAAMSTANSLTDLAGQRAQLDLAGQANKAQRRQTAFNNLAQIAGMAVGYGSGMGAGAGLWGGTDPRTGINWNSGRV